MRRIFLIAVILCLLLPGALAGSDFLSAEERLLIEEEVAGFFNGSEPTVIVGGGLTGLERALFKGLLAANQNLSDYPYYEEDAAPRNVTGPLLLLGGSRTNAFADFQIPPSQTIEAGPLRLRFYNESTLVIATEHEEENHVYMGIEKSPLSRFLPLPLVPVAASLLSLLLLLLGQLLLKVAAGVGKDIAALRMMGWWKERFADKEAKRHLRIRGALVPLREILTVIAGILLLGFATAWLYAGDYAAVLWSMLPASATIGLFRFLARKWYCHRNGLHIEAILWPLGTLVTFLSVLLGSLFSLTSYWRTHKDEQKRSAAHGWFLAVATMAFGFIAWLANLLWPSPYLQLLAVLGVTIPFIDLFPIPPLFGWSIWRWRKLRWGLTFPFALVLYLLVVFASQVFA